MEIPLVLLGHYFLRPSALSRKVVEAVAANWPLLPPRLAFVFGGGDHGGGPTSQLLKRLEEELRYSGLKVQNGSPAELFYGLDRSQLPVVEGMLKVGGLGVATQSRVKWLIRECEHLLLTLESLASVLSLSGLEAVAGRATELRERWKTLLKCQFHDALWGSTSYEPYLEVLGWLEELRADLRAELDEALARLASRVDTEAEGIPIVVFNPLPVGRPGTVVLAEVPRELPRGMLVAVDGGGNAIPVARTRAGLAFAARDVPAARYKVYWLKQGEPRAGARAEVSAGRIRLVADSVSAVLDAHTSRLLSLSAQGGPEIRFPDGDFRLEIWRDVRGAWDPGLTERIWTEGQENVEIRIVSRGPAMAAVSTRMPLPGGGWVEREIRVWAGLPWVECVIRGNWTLPRAQLLAVFDTGDTSLLPYTEVPFGAVDWEAEWERRLERSGVVERLKALRQLAGAAAEELGYQVPQLRWADICDREQGLAVLNRGLFGARLRPGSIVLPILRSPPFVEQGE